MLKKLFILLFLALFCTPSSSVFAADSFTSVQKPHFPYSFNSMDINHVREISRILGEPKAPSSGFLLYALLKRFHIVDPVALVRIWQHNYTCKSSDSHFMLKALIDHNFSPSVYPDTDLPVAFMDYLQLLVGSKWFEKINLARWAFNGMAFIPQNWKEFLGSSLYQFENYRISIKNLIYHYKYLGKNGAVALDLQINSLSPTDSF